MNKANECTCPSGDGSLVHPCPAHPAVEQAGGDERDFQAEGAQEVPSPVSQEYDRHLISLLRKGEALPGHQEEAADEIERLRDWNDHLNNTVLPNILNPTFLMLMKGGERLLDLCTKDGEFIGVSLNDMKDVFDWMVTHARIAPDQAALAQPSPAQTQPSPAPTLRAAIDVANDRFEVPVAKWGTDLVGEEERPEVAEVAFVLRNIGAMDAEDIDGDNVDLRFEDAEGRDTGCDVSIVEYAEKAADLFEQHDRIVGELRADRDSWAEQAEQRLADWDEMRKERDAALVEVERLSESKGDPVGSFEKCMKVMYERDENAKRLEVALARVAELEQKSAGSWTVDTSCGRPILMYEGCSVIEDQTAYEVIRMIKWIGELERQEPVATVAKVPGEDWNSLDFHRDLQHMQPGTKLYAAPVAQAQQLKDLDKQCRDDVARALGLRPNQERGFAWSYLLASIKSCVKASGDSAQAQHSVPDGWVQSLPLKDHQPCKSNEDRANGYVIPIYSRPVPVEEALRKLRAVLCDPVGNVVIDGSDGDREEVQRALGILAAAPGNSAQHSGPEGWKLVPIEPLLNMMSDKDHDTRITAERQLLSILAAAPGKEGNDD
ncbi:hypothetical protein NQL51_005018 [Pseudomonas aeruginosa]|uniref:hypothetical protein n=3 Tax=Pseudomonas aeruginosa TaxID=287 RepID=UPI0025A8FE74|nr:hypothetical protein [Pseudomonas aeruginosa]EIU3127348.1 hypothetical protein [Pseudomonas aeruginosa]EKT8385485.1 hypothetical protein [Pseudomonas aeruginosa]EKT9075911.1 hypothetical protein [Pseudomonas aeruginosa]EKT9149534.1 hypothetical protein [Pseudomonas aeruginosa]EKT9155898.1 hypothetical protein [Pseudomonas aeruginosa]